MSAATLQVVGKEVLIGGNQHEGWLPAGAATPLRNPIRAVSFSFEIVPEGGGYLLCSCSQDKELYSDTWHETLERAKQAAREDFGVEDDEWRPA